MPYKYVPDPILEPYRTIRSEGLRQHTIGTWLNIRDFMAENSIAYDFASDSEQLRVVSALEAFATLSYLAGFD